MFRRVVSSPFSRSLAVIAIAVAAQPAGSALAAPVPRRFEFRERGLRGYEITDRPVQRFALTERPQWLEARPVGRAGPAVQVGPRVVLKVSPGTRIEALADRLGLHPLREVAPGLHLLAARDAYAAAAAADQLGREPGVAAALPVMKRPLGLHGPYARRPDDPYFRDQWHLENRSAEGTPAGLDVNARAAWPFARGEGVTLAVVDEGVQLDHPDLRANAEGAPHFDFDTGSTNTPGNGAHATCVAGLAAGSGGNRVGISGVAPGARFASWVIFDPFGGIVADDRLMEMYEHEIQTVAVQNHSWGNIASGLSGPSLLEQPAIDRALRDGRGGRGVIMVRSAGNNREAGGDANYDGYPNDPRVIAVAAARPDGRAASYSSPGACLLVSAPSGDNTDQFNASPTLFTTDLTGSAGYNAIGFTNDLADYAFAAFGFSGTSASAPIVAGIIALMLSENPDLTLRDVQQALLHSARQPDAQDSHTTTNGAGYLVSHNHGFGVPDAGQAVQLARHWSNRPAAVEVTLEAELTEPLAVPDDGLKLWVREGVGAIDSRSIRALPALGPHPDEPTRTLPLAFVGAANSAISEDLHGRAALIERGGSFFWEKIDRAAAAGAEFTVIFNNVDGDALTIPGGTDFTSIPAVFISENEGRALVGALEEGTPVTGQLALDAAQLTFDVTNRLVLEHVGLRVQAEHPRRGDLRLTLVSPAGTRSVLQQLNPDLEPGPEDWTYWSVQHFYEGSAGTWQVFVSDEDINEAGTITGVSLVLQGVPVNDTDGDGLDDAWEQRHFGGLGARPQDDSDRDGSWNAREQALGTDPKIAEPALVADLSRYDDDRARLSWPASPDFNYQVLGGPRVDGFSVVTNLSGRFPEMEYFVPLDQPASEFLQIRKVNPPQ